MPTVFYITQRLQIETEGPTDETCIASAIFIHGAQRLRARLKWEVMSTELKGGVLSVIVKTEVYGMEGEPIDFQLLDKLLSEITLQYAGISEVLGGAFLNGYFKQKF